VTTPLIDRAQPETLLSAARQLYAEGRSRAEVIVAIYGVDLPAEALRFHAAYVAKEVTLSVQLLTNPWQLLSPPPAGATVDPISEDLEPAAFAAAPSMVPLLVTRYDALDLGEMLLGYDLDALRAGRTTIVGSPWPVDVDGTVPPVEVLGDSLLAVLAEILEQHIAQLAEWVAEPRRGYDEHHLDRAEAQLRGIEALRAGP
jgi:hypothetical protein